MMYARKASNGEVIAVSSSPSLLWRPPWTLINNVYEEEDPSIAALHGVPLVRQNISIKSKLWRLLLIVPPLPLPFQ